MRIIKRPTPPPTLAAIIVVIGKEVSGAGGGGGTNAPEGVGEFAEVTEVTVTVTLAKGTDAADAIICRTLGLELIPLIALITDEDDEDVARTRIEMRMLPAPVSVLATIPLPVTRRRSLCPELDVSFTEPSETRFGSTFIVEEIIA